ncbi:MAG: hypothetical protein LBT00_04245 [Spirochaetaceae bacterium]|jgi:hypothetical protein|nr:hypothetical protein [Spirochaetaceae bacterium]
MNNEERFIAYEYKTVTPDYGLESIYLDGFPNFGWEPDGRVPFVSLKGTSAAILKFKRDRNIKNKGEMARLERQFENDIQEIETLERSKTTNASIAAFTIGLIGTAFMAGSVFAYLAGMMPLMVILAIPGFLGWIFPYFCYMGIKAKRTQTVAPLIDKQYDAVYDLCEKAHAILAG